MEWENVVNLFDVDVSYSGLFWISTNGPVQTSKLVIGSMIETPNILSKNKYFEKSVWKSSIEKSSFFSL